MTCLARAFAITLPLILPASAAMAQNGDLPEGLTPFDRIATNAPPGLIEDADAVVLLNERIVRVDEKGRKTIVTHRVTRALTDHGAQDLREDVQPHSGDRETLRVALARVHLPNGEIRGVGPAEIIRQSPQYDAEQAIYSDRREVRVLFPAVAAGTVTEVVWVREEQVPLWPGEASETIFWVSPRHPCLAQRLLVEAAAPIAPRLRVCRQGDVPEPRVAGTAGGGRRWEWESGPREALRWEFGMPPLHQTGPLVRFTTTEDWNAFTRWYDGLLRPHSEADSALRTAAAGLAPANATRQEVIAAAFRRVARDVRYTGVEFGIAGLRPHPCTNVWNRAFGDCKDKSNLLRVLLGLRGIDAWMALIDTGHDGNINRDCPRPQTFDHAILAVDDGNGGLVWCDPTLSHAKPGILPAWDADRPALLIRSGKADWVRTPPPSPAERRVEAELDLDQDGTVSGWIKFTHHGMQAAMVAEEEVELNPENRRDSARMEIEGFLPDAGLADLRPSSFDPTNLVNRQEMFMLRPPALQTTPTGMRLVLPLPSTLHPGESLPETRRSPMHIFPYRQEMSVAIRTGANWTVEGLPPAFTVDGEGFKASGRVVETGGVIRVSMEVHYPGGVVPATRYAAHRGAREAFRRWIEHPLLLKPGAAAPPAGEVAAETEAPAMPMLSDGRSQLEFIDMRWPGERNPARRRAALEKARQLFPNDAETWVGVETRLSHLATAAGNAEEGVRRAANAAERARIAGLDADVQAWARVVQATAHGKAGQVDQAMRILRGVADDQGLPAARRASALSIACDLEEDRDRRSAARLMGEAMALDTPDRDEYRRLYFLHTGAAGMTNELRECAAAYAAEAHPEDILDTLEWMDAELTRLSVFHAELRPTLVAAFSAAVPPASEKAAKAWRETLAKWGAPLAEMSAIAALQDELSAWLVSDPRLPPRPEGWNKTLPRGSRQERQGAFQSAILTDPGLPNVWKGLSLCLEKPADEQTSQVLAECAVRLFDLVHLTPDAEPAVRHMAMGFNERLLRLPTMNAAALTAVDCQATMLLEDGRAEEALRLIEGWTKAPGFALEEAPAIGATRATLLFHLRRDGEALRALEGVRDLVGADQHRVRPGLLAMLACLGTGDHDAALSWMRWIAEVPDETLDIVIQEASVADLRHFLKHPDDARRWWRHADTWWPAWLDFLAAMDIKPSDQVADPCSSAQLFATSRAIMASNLRKRPDLMYETGGLRAPIMKLFPGTRIYTLAAPMVLADGHWKAEWIAARSELMRALILDAPVLTGGTTAANRGLDHVTRGWALVLAKRNAEALASFELALGEELNGEIVPTALCMGLLRITVSDPALGKQAAGLARRMMEHGKGAHGENTDVLLREIVEKAERPRGAMAGLLAKMQEAATQDKQGAKPYQDWIKAHAPAWLGVIPPNLRSRDHREVAGLISRSDCEAVRAKLAWHLAADPRAVEMHRERLFLAGLEEVADLERDPAEWIRLLGLATSPTNGLPADIQPGIRRLFAQKAASERNDLMRGRLIEAVLPLVEGTAEGDILRRYAAENGGTPKATELKAECQALLNQPVQRIQLIRLVHNVETLASMDAQRDVRDVLRQARRITMAEDEDMDQRNAIRMLEGTADQVEDWREFHRFMREHEQDRLQNQPPAPPELAAMRDPEGLDSDSLRRWLATQLTATRGRHANPKLWAAWLKSCRSAAGVKAGIDYGIVRDSLATLGTEELQCFWATCLFDSLVDPDEPEEVALLLRELRAHAEAENLPGLRAMADSFTIMLRVRYADVFDLEGETAKFTPPALFQVYLEKAVIEYHLRCGNREALRKMCDRTVEKGLSSTSLLPDYLSALGLLGDAEARRTLLRRESSRLDDVFTQALTRQGSGDLMEASRLLGALGSAQPATNVFWQAMEASLKSDRPGAFFLRAEIAASREDWPAVERETKAMLKVHPSYHDANTLLARALLAQKKDEQAVPHLAVVVRRCGNSPYHAEALRELRRLAPEQVPEKLPVARPWESPR